MVLPPCQSEICQSGMALDQQDVVGLDVAVQHTFAMQIIERLGRLAEVADQLGRRDALSSLQSIGLEAFAQAAVGQVHDDEQLVLLGKVSVRADQEVMGQALDDVQGALLAQPFLMVRGTIDDFDGDGETAGRRRLPDFAEAAAAEELLAPVAAADGQPDFGVAARGVGRSGTRTRGRGADRCARDRIGAHQTLQGLERTGEAVSIRLQWNPVAEAQAHSIFFVNQRYRQTFLRPQFRKALEVVIQSDAAVAPPSNLQFGLDQFHQSLWPKCIPCRRQIPPEVGVVGLLPCLFEAVGQIAEASPSVGAERTGVGETIHQWLLPLQLRGMLYAG